MIDVGQDYSKDRKNTYTAETGDGYVAGWEIIMGIKQTKGMCMDKRFNLFTLFFKQKMYLYYFKFQ